MKKIVAALFVISLLLRVNGTAASLPDKLRVLAIDLQNARIETPGTPGSELSQELRRVLEMADVDIVCVQGAIDWENCERLCQLKTGLQVLTCSAFTNTAQVAIISRVGAVLSWVEEGDGGNGFALAILQAGSKRLAVFSVQSAKATGPTAPTGTEYVLPEVKRLTKLPQNRPDSFLIAGAGMVKTTLLTDNAFQTVSAEPAAANSPEFFVMNGGFLTRPRTVNLRGLKNPLSVCDFDTSSSFSSKFAYQTPLLFAGETLASIQPPAPAIPAAPKQDNRLIWGVSIGVFIFFVLLWLLKPRRTSMQLVPMNAPKGMIEVDDPMRSNLLAWIKSAFLQRLISHRQQLLNNEAEATRRTRVIEEKISNLQSVLQSRISAYEARIERLEQELTAATLDNRELIRAQIDLLKEKVAKAKQEHSLGRN